MVIYYNDHRVDCIFLAQEVGYVVSIPLHRASRLTDARRFTGIGPGIGCDTRGNGARRVTSSCTDSRDSTSVHPCFERRQRGTGYEYKNKTLGDGSFYPDTTSWLDGRL
jgi:hypothetical protein